MSISCSFFKCQWLKLKKKVMQIDEGNFIIYEMYCNKNSAWIVRSAKVRIALLTLM